MKKEKDNKDIESSVTPMVKQYLDMKKIYKDVILFFRIGDFYEMFLDDAEIASKELQLFLTRKACGNGNFIPMCGIPHHAYLQYAQKLIDRGYKVAICEQVEDPKLTKKLVKRDVVQMITPGANLDLVSSDNNYIASLEIYPLQSFIAYCDVSTGEMKVVTVESSKEKILEELLSLDIKELVVSTSLDSNYILYIKSNSNICISYHNDTSTSIEMDFLFDNIKDNRMVETTSRLFNYIREVEKRDLTYFKPAINMMAKKNMKIDYSASSNMELVRSLDGKSFGTLYWLLNKSKTPMGSRLLKDEILHPQADQKEIEKRLDTVQLFLDEYILREQLRDDLSSFYDTERLIARMQYESCNGHDLLQLKKSLQILPILKEHLKEIENNEFISEIITELYDYTALVDRLEKAIDENCPTTISEGEIFKKGYDKQLDELIDLSKDGKTWITDLERREKERTGIHNLKVGFNSVFGYYIEVLTSQIPLVKDEYGYIRKQTLKTGERYITSELKEHEDKILRAKELRTSLEYKLFKELRSYVSTFTDKIQITSNAIAKLDFILTLSFVSSENNYYRPHFNNNYLIDVKECRHPIIEKANPELNFVSNDYYMDKDSDVLIITGPNMGGKSTYMKQFGLLVIMAQIGCFVPARNCSIPVFSSLFTRIGASDNLIKGQSTFMTEMSEVAQGLEEADCNSLFLFDEIGRGTATFDGMAIAQAIIEYIVKNIHCKTLFSTHYHEITKLSEKITAVKNIHCCVKEEEGHVTFLYKMKEGSMDKSYGVNVAKLAGLPNELVSRASDLLYSLEQRKDIKDSSILEVKREVTKDPIIDEIKRLDPMTLSPLEALNYLIDLKKRIK